MAKKKSFSFEDTITSLSQIIEDLESGDLSLEDSLKNFEKGIELTRIAQKTIAESEQSVHLLLQDGSAQTDPVIQDLDNENEEDQ